MFPHKRIHKETWASNDGRTRNQIDHVIVNTRHVRNIIDVKSQRGAEAGTDHFLVRVKVRSRIKRPVKEQEIPRTKRWNVAKLKQDETCRQEYQNELITQLGQNIANEEADVENCWNQIKTSITKALEKTIGEIKGRGRKHWYDGECQKIQDTKNKARLRMLQSPSNENILSFNTLRTRARKLIRRKKREAYNRTIDNIESEARSLNSRNFFREITNIRKGFKPQTNILKKANNDLITDPQEVLQTWKEFFENLLNTDVVTASTNKVYQTAEEYVPEPSLEEVKRAINHLKNNKAPGEDFIAAECLKYGGEQLHKAIHELLKNIWITETLPKEWNESTIIPIHKKGDRLTCKNYRGITLLNVTYKVLSNVLKERISPYAEDNLGEYQCGFRPNRSTTDQIFTIRQLLEKSWEFNRDVHQLFIDFRQAYDSIARDSIWKALEDIGVPKKIIQITKQCIGNSKAKVRIGNRNTDTFSINNGLKQGDGLSPLLFNIVLDMAIKNANIGLEIFTNQGPEMLLAYADDIDTVGGSTVKTKEMFVKIEKETRKVGLTINEDKTKYMHVSRGPRGDRIRQNITMDTYNFECVSQFQYLGAVITSDNDVSSEIKMRIQKGNRCFFAMRDLFKSRLLSKYSKIRIYSAVIKPVILYGSETWTITKQNELLLKRFERKMLRRIFGPIIDQRTGQYRIRTNEELKNMYSGPCLVNEIKAQRLRWAGHVQRSQSGRLIKRIWEENPRGKRPLGRPRLRWRDNIRDDMNILGVQNWREAMLDRDRWRRIINAAKTHEGL